MTVAGTNPNDPNMTYEVKVLDANEIPIATGKNGYGTLEIQRAELWWPYLMSDTPGYQHILRVRNCIYLFLLLQMRKLEMY